MPPPDFSSRDTRRFARLPEESRQLADGTPGRATRAGSEPDSLREEAYNPIQGGIYYGSTAQLNGYELQQNVGHHHIDTGEGD